MGAWRRGAPFAWRLNVNVCLEQCQDKTALTAVGYFASQSPGSSTGCTKIERAVPQFGLGDCDNGAVRGACNSAMGVRDVSMSL